MSTNEHHGAARRSSEAVFGQVMGLVALTVGCVAISAYMGRDLTGGAAIALSVDAVTCLVGLNSASPEGRPLTREHAAVRAWSAGSDRSPRRDLPARSARSHFGIGDHAIARGLREAAPTTTTDD